MFGGLLKWDFKNWRFSKLDVDELHLIKVSNGYIIKEFNYERNDEVAAYVHVFKTIGEILDFVKKANWRRSKDVHR